MDDKLFDIFSEETTVPKCVLDRIDETLDTLERTEDKKERNKKHRGTNQQEKLEAQPGPFLCSCDGIWGHRFCC